MAASTVIVLFGLFYGAQGAQAGCQPGYVELRSQDGTVARLSVELARTLPEQMKGLMDRHEMPQGHGMLFLYEGPHVATFWMHDTYIPLDIIFMDPAGRVLTIQRNAKPLDDTPLPGGPGVQYVLEVNAGVAARLGMGPGTVMRHAALDQDSAAWPCEAP